LRVNLDIFFDIVEKNIQLKKNETICQNS
jgi:hypothetical protein